MNVLMCILLVRYSQNLGHVEAFKDFLSPNSSLRWSDSRA